MSFFINEAKRRQFDKNNTNCHEQNDMSFVLMMRNDVIFHKKNEKVSLTKQNVILAKKKK